MTLFFDYKVALPDKRETACVAWQQQHILAVGAKDGSVTAFLEEGERLEDIRIERANQIPCVLRWNKVNRSLFVGWGDGSGNLFVHPLICFTGVLSMWSDTERLHKEFGGGGKPIKFIVLDGRGKRLVCGGEESITLWKNSKKNGLQVIKEHKLAGTVNFGIMPSHDRENSRCPWFVCAGTAGKLWSLDEKGNCNELIAMNAAISGLFYDTNRDYVVAVTTPPNPLLANLRPGIAASSLEYATPPQKLDIQIPDSSLVWVGSALASAEGSSLRIWIDGKGAVLPSKDTGRYTSLAYDPLSNVLASGTTNGKLHLWQILPQGKAETLAELDVGSTISHISCGPDGLLACTHPEAPPTILVATTLHQAMSHQVAALQVAPDRILLEKYQGSGTTLQTGIRIKGMFLNNNQLAVWNGQKVEVYQLKESPNNPHAVLPQLVGSFNTTATTIVVHGENVFTCIGNRVEAFSFKGISKQSLSFAEAEGEPHVMDLRGEYLGVATRNNVVRIYDISRREARLHGSDRRFDVARDGFSAIISMKINATGTLVCLIVEGNKGSSVASSKIIIYAIERDVTFSYDFESIGQYVSITFSCR